MSIDGSERRQRLRCATQPAHARLDALIDATGLLGSRARYARYLEATWAARRPAERALDALGSSLLYAAWPERSMCEALSQDIVDVAGSPPVEDSQWDLPAAPLSPGQALGVLYVLEGSALGARLLERRVAAIGMTSAFGARHMARQTARPRAWAAFVKVLDRTVLDPPDDQLCMSAAVDTFHAFERAFQAVQ
jgi:heme oxygenase